jgi:hypothetical protein
MALNPSYPPDPEDDTKPGDTGVALGYIFKEVRFLKGYLQDKLNSILLPHIADVENPHATTKAHVGLPDVPDWDSSIDPVLGDSDTTIVSQLAIKTALANLLSETVYRVGSYYTSEDDATPADVLGFGTWSLLEAGRMLVSREAADNLSEYYVVGTQGGAHQSVITMAQMPAHKHDVVDTGHTHNIQLQKQLVDKGSEDRTVMDETGTSDVTRVTDSANATIVETVKGGSTPLDFRNKYHVTNIWRRVA